MHTNMGNRNSVQQKSFEEEYFMFFDNGRLSFGPNGAQKLPTFGREDSVKPSTVKAPSEKKLVSRATPILIYDESTNVGSMPTISSDTTGRRRNDSLRDEEVILSPKRTTQCINGVVTRDYPKTGTSVDNLYKEVWTPEGRLYQGYWRDGEMFNGRIVWPDGKEYQGGLKDGLPHGYGVYYKTGKLAEFHGYWYNGLQHGQGVYISRRHACPIVRRGTWHMGQMVQDDASSPQNPRNVRRRILLRILMDEDFETTPTNTMIPCSGSQMQ